MGRRWFTSDQHFSHESVATLRGFADAAEQTAVLTENWRRQVRDDDIVYMLGDVTGIASGFALDAMLAFIADLPGRKHLIAGNHDAVSSVHRSGWRHQLRYLNVFESVRDFGRIRIDGQDVLMSHYPYPGPDDDHTDRSRYREYRLSNWGLPLLHGHTHRADQRLHGNQIHVGVDAWDWRLVAEGEIVQLLERWNERLHNGPQEV